jgi:DNA-binding Lrp family transcriptional regulator
LWGWSVGYPEQISAGHTTGLCSKMKLDNKDKKIIAELKKNSRQTVRDIAKQTGIRPSTVHQRITKMRKEGIIEKFTVKLSNAAIGENFIVFMFVSTKTDLSASFFQNKHIKDVFGVTGEYDLLIKLKFKDVDEFNNFVISLRKNKAIEKTLTSVATITLKEEI